MSTKVGKVSSLLSSKFNWRINNFSKLKYEASSGVFSVGVHKWEAHIYPKGDEGVYDHISMYLFPRGWRKDPVDTKFSFAITSQTDLIRRRESKYKFNTPSMVGRGWGWEKFMPLSELHDPIKKYIVDDTCVIGIDVSCWVDED